MPIAINSSPTPSPINAPNGGISNAPRTTTTSRRGGRNRSRSPPVMGGRLSSGSPFPVVVGENLSSAAAAAAATAKAFSNAPPPNGRQQHSAWPEGGRAEQGYHGYDKQHYPQGSSTSPWRAGGRGGEDARLSYRYPGEYQGYPGAQYRDERYSDGRYREPSSQYYDERGQPMPHQHRSSRGRYPTDYRYSHGPGDARSYPGYGREAHASAHQRPGGGGTSLVIGGPTPIHLPKSAASGPMEHRPIRPDSRASSRHSSRLGTAESVFRGRSKGVAPVAEPAENDSPQKILLSLRTPSTSFEKEDKAGEKKESGRSGKPDDLLESNRSPEDSKNSESIETAPSFSLFNQSFDSFGDGPYFNVDVNLQNDSFGMGRFASVDPESANQIMQSPSTNFSQQLLATNSGALTLGYSPANSFGNASAAPPHTRRSGSVMVGGNDPSASPTDSLAYQTYMNVVAPKSSLLDDSHLRMSGGSFGLGVASMPYSRSYAEGPGGSPNYYYGAGGAHESPDGVPPFYTFLAKYKSAFKECSFLLPGLKIALLQSPLQDELAGPAIVDAESSQSIHGMYGEPLPQDIAIARRRVETSVLAFGGNPNSRDNSQSTKPAQSVDKSSIFRSTNDASVRQQAATVTPGSTTSSGEKKHHNDHRIKSSYEAALPNRYYENESRLSWEFEEAPPVEISNESDNADDDPDESDSPNMSPSHPDGKERDNGSEDGKSNVGEKRITTASITPQAKMRYRCKLCGQPKQNHTCPYQQSLARSIGVMIFPSVNAFAADEPGLLAPPLIEMNNFFDAKEPGSNDSTPSRPSPDRMRSRIPTLGQASATAQVTPESMRSSSHLHSPTSSYVATPARTTSRHESPRRHAMSSNRKRSYASASSPGEERDLLFMESMELKVEQFRVVTPSKALNAPDAFCYPSLPLPYAQRKRLSDNLFALSNEIPKLTDECAQVLREAREKDMWDLAVAELMTQVIVIIHCPDGDAHFEGLRQYLLTLGIAC